MHHSASKNLQQFREEVGVKFQLYNSLFTSLPFHRIEKTGILLSLLSSNCEDGLDNDLSPVEIIENFFSTNTSYASAKDQHDLLFRFVQYIERQVVLFDALEDAAFSQVNDLNGTGSLKNLFSGITSPELQEKLNKCLVNFNTRIVLTAHPTQFYPGPVLGIINDLSKALANNNTGLVNMYLQQLGKTPFFKKKKPTPYDEATSLLWYMENVFYAAAGKIVTQLKAEAPESFNSENPGVRMGFWPGGDRDGNPFVTASITRQVAEALRGSILKCYYLDIRKLRRRLTFQGVEELVMELENKLYQNLFIPGHQADLDQDQIMQSLISIRDILNSRHNGLFVYLVDNLIGKVEVFGLHFATLDIRQESSVHTRFFEAVAGNHPQVPAAYSSLHAGERQRILTSITETYDGKLVDPLLQDLLETVSIVADIQKYNGEAGCNRYIISQCKTAINALEVYGLFLMGGFQQGNLNIDIVPLFETIEDLQRAPEVMQTLYSNKQYVEHLKRRNNTQTIMLGFSDGTKDGGYLMANWSIYRAKESLTAISKNLGFDVVFFDGRGGPPSRGGGKTHKFYASLGNNISNKEIQLTIQGQTVSSNFGTVDSAQYNIEQLLNAGISNALFPYANKAFTKQEEQLLDELSEASFKSYMELREHPALADYLLQVSPLRFYNETNIGSRPAKRGQSSGLSLKDLRAVPFAGSWSQLKQNVTGYYGVGAALRMMDQQGRFKEVQELYGRSLFFRTLIDNCEMAMMKSYFKVTEFLESNEQFGSIWSMIKGEYDLTKSYLEKLTGESELMAGYPVDQLSIVMRERIVLPLVIIQQYALTKLRDLDDQDPALKAVYEKLVMRCSFGIINAGRNAA